MGKALMGTYTTPRAVELLDEVRALRRRVAELERALDAAERRGPAANADSDADETIDLVGRRSVRANA